MYEITKNDTFFSAEEAVEWGAATDIGTFAPGEKNSLTRTFGKKS